MVTQTPGIIASIGSLFGAGIFMAIAVYLIGLLTTCLIIKLFIDYAARRIGKEVAEKFNYDYLAKMIAYEMKSKSE